jgi:hypothetical protein
MAKKTKPVVAPQTLEDMHDAILNAFKESVETLKSINYTDQPARFAVAVGEYARMYKLSKDTRGADVIINSIIERNGMEFPEYYMKLIKEDGSTPVCKIQVNTTRGIKQLIVESPEFGIEIKKTVLRDIATVAPDLIREAIDVRRLSTSVQEDIEKSLFAISGSGWSKTYGLKPEHKEHIKREVDAAVTKVIVDTVNTMHGEITARFAECCKGFDERFEKSAEDIMAQLTESNISRLVDLRVAAKLNKMMEGLK